MDNLNELVNQYKKTQDDKIFEQILVILQPKLRKKVDFIYNKLKYYKIELKDIQQELYLKILKIINEYNPKEPFENYFFSSLKTWLPKLQIEDIINYELLFKINEEGEEIEINVGNKHFKKSNTNLNMEDILHECISDNEKKICQLYLENPDITEEEIGKELKMTKQAISLIIKKLRNRLKKIKNITWQINTFFRLYK